jgi:hypothetical protein
MLTLADELIEWARRRLLLAPSPHFTAAPHRVALE